MNNKENTIEQALIIKAVNNLVGPVKVTLGAKGKTVLYNDTKGHDKSLWDGKPFTSKDGYTVAKQIKSKNEYEALIMAAIKAASQNTVNSSGDGTTSTMILTEALINQGIELITKHNMTSWEVCALIDIFSNDITTLLKEKYAISVIDEKTDKLNLKLLERVASVSSNDKEIGKFIYNIYSRIGTTGTIEVQTSEAQETKVRMTEGMRLNKGYYSTLFSNTADGSQFKATAPYVLVFDDAIRDYNQLMPFLRMTDQHNKGKKPLVVFCDEVSQVAMATIVDYVKLSNHPLCIVQNDQFGEKRLDLINDIASLTGGFPISSDTEYAKNHEYYKDKDFETLPEFSILGRAKEVLITNSSTSIIGNPDFIDKEHVSDVVSYLKEKIADTETQLYDKQHYQRRLANLTGGIALIKVGGATELEMKELFFRYEDAVLAVRSAIEKGVSIGGGYTWVNMHSDLIDSYDVDAQKLKVESNTYNMILNTLLAVPKQLLINAGFTSNNEFKFYTNNLINENCLDLITNTYMSVNDFEIYDSCATLLDVVLNAASVAKTLISVDKIIANNIVYKGE
jgi:chaperonin GroEL